MQKVHKLKKDVKSKMDETKDKEMHLEGTKEIDLPTIDVSKYIGKEAKIELVTEHKGEFGFYIKIQTEIIDTVTGAGGKNPIELRASRIFGLQQDEDKNIGWGKDTNLGIFLAKHKVEHYKDLVGKTIKVQTTTSKKSKRDFLSFN